MKKILNLSIFAFLLTAVGQLNAQTEKLLNGSFASSTSWTVGANAAGVVGDAQFGQTADLPAGSVSTTCLKLSQGGVGKPEVQVYQKINLLSSQMYKISAKIKCNGVATVNRAVQVYIMKNALPDNGTMFTDAIVNSIDAVGADRSKSVSLFLEGWPFSGSVNSTLSLNGAMPVSFDGTNTEYFKPPSTGSYLVLIKCGQWVVTSPYSVTISDLSVATSTVTGVAVSGVSVSPSVFLTGLGETSQLKATITPAGATNKVVTWTSSNPAVATVSSTGLVTAVASGKAVVTVTTSDGGKIATCPITVTTGSFNKLVWSDEFDGTGAPDPTKWGYETGYVRNNELQYYTKDLKNASRNNGQLDITVIKEQTNGYAYSSASLISNGKLDQTYGKIEGKFKIPKGKGLWACFWTLGSNYTQVWWPQCSEMDIFEHINSDDVAHHTAHWGDLTGAHVGKGDSTVVADITQWHVYSIEWTPANIRWFVDGVKHHEVNITNAINNTVGFHKPHYILMDLPMGGSWPGTPDPTITSATMSCDYIRVYDWTPDVPLTVTGLTVSPSTLSLSKGNPMQLTVDYLPVTATNKSVTWTSSNVAVATVSSTGAVTGVGYGSATITATSSDGSITASSVATVLDPYGINFIKNPGFELDNAAGQTAMNWSEWSSNGLGKDSASVVFGDAHTGNYKGLVTGKGPYTVMTYQGITGLPAGTYTLKVWVRSTGGLTTAAMSIKNYGATGSYSETQFTAAMSTWTQKTINNINITSGVCEVGINATGGANQTLEYDDLELTMNNPGAGISGLNSNNISIYPTVVKDNKLNVHNEGNEEYTVSVLSLNGQVLIENQVNAGNYVLNTASLKNGMYMIKVVSGSQTFTDKFVVK